MAWTVVWEELTPPSWDRASVHGSIKNFCFKAKHILEWNALAAVSNTDVYASNTSELYTLFSLPMGYYNQRIIIITEFDFYYRFVSELAVSVALKACNDCNRTYDTTITYPAQFKRYTNVTVPLVMYSQQFVQYYDMLYVLIENNTACSHIHMFNLKALTLQNTVSIPIENYYNGFAFDSCITTNETHLFIINQGIIIYDMIYNAWIESNIHDFSLVMSGCATSLSNDMMFIFGGLYRLVDGMNTIMDTVYQYDIINDSIYLLEEVTLKHPTYALRALATANHKIYLYDGVTNQERGAEDQLLSVFDVQSRIFVSYQHLHDTNKYFSTATYDYNAHLLLRYRSTKEAIELLAIDPVSIDFSVTNQYMWRSEVHLQYVFNDYNFQFTEFDEAKLYTFQLSYSNTTMDDITHVMMIPNDLMNMFGTFEDCYGCNIDIYDQTMDSITINITSIDNDVEILFSNVLDIGFKTCTIHYQIAPESVKVNESVFVHTESGTECFENPLIGDRLSDGYIANMYNQRAGINHDIIVGDGICSICNVDEYDETQCVTCDHGISPFIDDALEVEGRFTINISSKTTDLVIIPALITIDVDIQNVDYSAHNGLTPEQTAAIVSASTVFILLVSGVILCCRQKNRKLKARQEKYKHEIQNPLVTMIGIGEYMNQTDIANRGIQDIVCPDLDGIDVDYTRMKKMCELLHYDFYPQQPNLKWTEEDIISQLKESAEKTYQSLSTDDPYDSILVVFSAHGWKNSIITSDYHAVNKDAIHRLFGANYPELRSLPRIFVFDCCDGNQSRSVFPSTYKDDIDEECVTEQLQGKNVGPDDVLFRVDGDIWKSDQLNPDYKLVTIHGANVGFQAKMDSIEGSFLIHHLVRGIYKNIDEKQHLFFGEIVDNIQQELHADGKQQPVSTFNNHTRYLQFQKGKQIEK